MLRHEAIDRRNTMMPIRNVAKHAYEGGDHVGVSENRITVVDACRDRDSNITPITTARQTVTFLPRLIHGGNVTLDAPQA